MSIDLGNAPVGTPPTSEEQAQIRTAIGAVSSASLDLKADLSEINNAAQHLYWTMNHLNDARQATTPLVLRCLTIGDSWAQNCVPGLKGIMGSSGMIKNPQEAALNGTASRSTVFSEFPLSPWGGQSITLSTNTSSYATWGYNNDGTVRLPVGRYIVVVYEGAASGSATVQYEDAAGAWQTAGTITLSSVGTSGLQVWESPAIGPIATRVRVVWASGTPKILAAGVTQFSANTPVVAANRQGVFDLNTSLGGSSLTNIASTSQASWSTLLAWAKPDIVFIRDKSDEANTALWSAAMTTLISRVRTARPECDIVFIGRHLTGDGSETLNASNDEWCREYASNADNAAMFIDTRAFMPATFAQGVALGLNRAIGDDGGIHLTAVRGQNFLQQIIFNHMQPILNFLNETGSNYQNGPFWYGRGVSATGTDFPIFFDGSTGAGAGIGFYDLGLGTVNAGTRFNIWQYGSSSTDFRGNGVSFRTGSQSFASLDSQSRWFIGGIGNELNSRSPSGRFEVFSGQADRVPIVCSGISGQTSNLHEWRVGVTGTSGSNNPGSLATRVDATGNLKFETAGLGISLKTGSNARIGTGQALTAGVATVANTSVTANTMVVITKTANGGTAGIHYIVTKNAGTSFTITATDTSGATVTTDTSTFDWHLIERI